MMGKGFVIFIIGVVGIISTVVLWLISVFKTPEDIKTYFIYDDDGDVAMINKAIRANDNTITELSNTDLNATERVDSELEEKDKYLVSNQEADKTQTYGKGLDETSLDVPSDNKSDETLLDTSSNNESDETVLEIPSDNGSDETLLD